MKLVNFHDFLGRVGRKLEVYGGQRPTPVNLKNLVHFGKLHVFDFISLVLILGKTEPASKSFDFLRTELPIRMAHMIKECKFLPESLLQTPSVLKVAAIYEDTLDKVLKYAKCDSKRSSVVSEFTDDLQLIIEQNVNAVAQLAAGLNEMKKTGECSLEEATQLQYFLDRFYISRIGIRTLMTQHVLLYGPVLRENESYVGCIDPECSPLQLTVSAYGYARMLCHRVYGRAPGCVIELFDRVPRSKKREPLSSLSISVDKDGKPSGAAELFTDQPNCAELDILGPNFRFCYIPGHLFHVLFELLKNSMRAVVEHRHQDSELPRLHIVICHGRKDVTIKLSDLGGGMPDNVAKRAFEYTFTTASQLSPILGAAHHTQPHGSRGPDNDPESATFSPLAGRGHGLPLSRLYARYLSGDLKLVSIENFGSSAFIYLKRLPEEANELLPIFNRTSKAVYESPYTLQDWTSRIIRRNHAPHVSS
ncbi:hypothetical protein CRM22_006401 [Opisthorchis felineus]|uniref:Protein-serine/threonine kinase n=1 Tax=Opisthorchis felineus TaxID=147828 RepID=A0A4S2LL50_OPIFE|nr:hypothetical protein CRM22_006401 [Opisthorchis felineus]TGZ64373.1 hypothetical protein CRM22_006401 [Opisthorchis felineus]